MIVARTLPLASTEGGKDWVIKALHPSDPLTEVRGIPDRSAAPTVHLNYQSVFTLSPRGGATGTWECDVAVLPHPVNFLWYHLHDSTGTADANFMNTQLSGATHALKMGSLLQFAERWRLTYMGVTVHQDGPDLANQGTVVACQRPFEPFLASCSALRSDSSGYTTILPMEVYQAGDAPDYSVSQTMPNAYFNQSKFGVYMPLKLDESHQRWVSAKDLVVSSATTSSVPTGTYDYPNTGPGGGLFPHTNIAPGSVVPYGPISGSPTSPMLCHSAGSISFRNMAATTSLTFFLRFGLELQVVPGTLYSANLKLSPPFDPVAIDSYYAIAREMKDAYPADYNDLGKIWDVISSIAKTVAPSLSLLGPVGSAVGLGIGGAARVGDAIKAAVTRVGGASSSGSYDSVASAADKEVARRVVTQATEVKQRKKIAKASKKKKLKR